MFLVFKFAEIPIKKWKTLNSEYSVAGVFSIWPNRVICSVRQIAVTAHYQMVDIKFVTVLYFRIRTWTMLMQLWGTNTYVKDVWEEGMQGKSVKSGLCYKLMIQKTQANCTLRKQNGREHANSQRKLINSQRK